MRSTLKLRLVLPVALGFAAAVTAAVPATAEMFKWVDERGMTHYSDKKPEDPKAADKVKTVNGNLSVYSPDKSLLRAVEVARDKASRPDPVEPDRAPRFYAAPTNPQPPVENDPCLYNDCGQYYPVAAYPYRRRPQHLGQAVLPPGATAGTVNSPGIIPGNTGTQFGVPTRTSGSQSRTSSSPRPPLDSRSFR